jgi:hypothetical protein
MFLIGLIVIFTKINNAKYGEDTSPSDVLQRRKPNAYASILKLRF